MPRRGDEVFWRKPRGHLDDTLTAAIVDGGHEPTAAQRAHVASCGRCAGLLEGHRRARDLLLRLNPEAPLPAPGGSAVVHTPILQPLLLVASAAVVAAIALRAVTIAPAAAPETNTATPTQSVSATASALPSPSRALSPYPAGPNDVWVAVGPTGAAGASWSPDSLHLLVWSAPDEAGRRAVELADADGTLVKSFRATDVAWVDADAYVARGNGQTVLIHVSTGSAEQSTGPAGFGWLSNGQGAIAYLDGPGASVDSPGPDDHFSVWSEHGVVTGVSGRPVAWSPDGSQLAVWRYGSSSGGVGGQPIGTIGVYAWPGLHLDHEWPAIEAGSAPVRFDPSGHYLEIAGPSGFSAVDVTTGSVVSRSVGTGQPPVWDESSDLVVPSLDGTVSVYGSDGHLLSSRSAADSLAGSTNGRTIILFWWESSQPAVLSSSGAERTLALPGALWTYPEVSANGSGIVIFCQTRAGDMAFVLRYS
jgi:hypothetical protein